MNLDNWLPSRIILRKKDQRLLERNEKQAFDSLFSIKL